MLALLNPDGMGATRGWRLARSWHLRSDDSIEGAALGLRADASTASVFDAYTARGVQFDLRGAGRAGAST
jgi:hypothetical protein